MLYRVLLAVSFLSAAVACSQAVEPSHSAESDQTNDESEKESKLDRFERDGSAFDSRPPESSGESLLLVLPATTYSGFDGVHSFKVPIQVHGSGTDLELGAEDPSAVKITEATLADATGDKGKWFIVETKTTGRINLIAKSNGKTAHARVLVANYDPARWTIGEARYQGGGGGDPACTNCHVNGRAIDHSPAAMARATDGEVSFIVSRGERTNHTPIGSTGCSDCTAGGKDHHWTATPDELAGLVAYLRGLPPRGFQ